MTDRLSDLAHAASSSLSSLLAGWTRAQRLYTLEGEGGVAELMVERFSLADAVNEPYRLQLHTLSLHAQLDLHALLGQRITLFTTQADGSRQCRSGLVMEAREAGA